MEDIIQKIHEETKDVWGYIDIHEHLETLKQYGDECETVTEFGSRDGISTIALLYSNCNNIFIYDIAIRDRVKELYKRFKEQKNIVLHEQSTIDTSVSIENTDLLFIDTYHNYQQLIQELTLHSKMVNKYIILHDTVTFSEVGENLSRDGMTYDGLTKALTEFLESHKEWQMFKHYENNNGLTILRSNK